MPLKRLDPIAIQRPDELRRELAEEWRQPSDAKPEPMIIEQGGRSPTQPEKVIVVWSKWSGLPHELRSEVILDACAQALGISAMKYVYSALGLTPEEADRMKIDYRQAS